MKFTLNAKDFVKIKSQNLKTIILVSIILNTSFFSLAIFEGRNLENMKDFPNPNTISQEELDMISFLEGQNVNSKIFCSHITIGTRIQGYGFYQTFLSDIYISNIYYGWVNKSYIDNHSEYELRYLIKAELIYYTGEKPQTLLINQIADLNIDNQETIHLLKELNIQYLITLKDNGEYLPFIIDKYGRFPSMLLNSTINNLTPIYETEHLALYRFY
ncbi:hypothetical protein [Candidatus Harpocratesius sp.]